MKLFTLLIGFGFLFITATTKAQQSSDANKIIDSSLKLAAQQYGQLNQAVPVNYFPRTLDASGNLITATSTWWTSGFL